MTQIFGQSVCSSGLNSSKGPCLWPWRICPLLSTVIHYVMHAFAVVLTDLSCGNSGRGIMFNSDMRRLRHWMSGRGALSFGWRRCCRVVCCCWKAMMTRNVTSISKIVSHVIYPLRVQFILNWPSCQRAFYILCVERRNEQLLCSRVINVNVVGTWHAWGHPWLLYHLDSGVVLAVEDLWYLVLPPNVLNDHVWFSSSCVCPNGKWGVMA